MQNRFYGLDYLRAILMLIGILIHSVAIINPYAVWRYHSKFYENEVIYLIIYSTHFFRMEAFFLIAGFFSCMVINKKGIDYYLKNRVKRVLIPFISSIIFISSICTLYDISVNNLSIENIKLSNIIMHFWFLLTLFILSILTIQIKFNKYLNELNIKLPIIFLILGAINLAILSFKFLILKITNSDSFYFQLYYYVINNTIYYAIFYFMGYILFINKAFYCYISNLNLKFFFLLSAILLFLSTFFFSLEANNIVDNFLLKAFFNMFNFYTSIIVSCFLFATFTTLKFNYSNSIKFLVDSSIIIYLFHVPILLITAYLLDIKGLTSWFYFIIISALTYVFTFMAYFIVRNFRILKFLFGLK